MFHNLRASRETELMREYDLATVCKWIGNSPAVAAKHYATSVDLDSDFKRAAGIEAKPAAKAQQNAQQSAAGGDDRQSSSVPANAEEPKKSGITGTRQHRLANLDKSGGWALQDSKHLLLAGEIE